MYRLSAFLSSISPGLTKGSRFEKQVILNQAENKLIKKKKLGAEVIALDSIKMKGLWKKIIKLPGKMQCNPITLALIIQPVGHKDKLSVKQASQSQK